MNPPKCRFCGVAAWNHTCGNIARKPADAAAPAKPTTKKPIKGKKK